MTSIHDLTLDAASQAWDALAARIDALVAAWDAGGDPPELAAHLPSGPAELRHLVLVELVKVDLEYRWLHRHLPKKLEAYQDEFPELAPQGQIPCDLIFEEYYIRQRSGENIPADDYRARFPEQAEELGRLLDDDLRNQTTMICARDPADPPRVGERLDDFDLLAQLGHGAFAQVYLARQVSMQRLVALKVSSDRGDEPQTLAQLDHPHIVRVYDQRVLPEKQMRLLYMQVVPGGTLQEVLAHIAHLPRDGWNGALFLTAIDAALDKGGYSPPTESSLRGRLSGASWGEMVAWIGARLAAALDYANQKGVLHRDVKPANVLLDAEGSPKLADFNISFCSQVEGATPTAFFGGSLAYMSPEQIEAYNPSHPRSADDLDARCDVYSLGVLLWELITGQRPWGVESFVTAWPATLEKMAARRQDLRLVEATWNAPPGCPSGLKEILLRCLAPDPADRWSSGEQLAQQFELCLIPQARELLTGARSGWRRWVTGAPLTWLLLVILIPNVVGATFNLLYNMKWINEKPDEFREVFDRLTYVVNPVLFAVGIGLLVALALPLTRWLPVRTDVAIQSADEVRRRALRLGHFTALLGVLEWLVAGVMFPVGLSIFASPMEPAEYAHFLSSMTICGLMAATYTYFAVMFLAARVFVPALLSGESIVPGDAAALADASRLSYLYLLLAMVPTAGIFLLLMFGKSVSTLPILVLSGGGIIGFSIAFGLYRHVQRDLDLLSLIVHRGQPAAAGMSDTVSGLAPLR